MDAVLSAVGISARFGADKLLYPLDQQYTAYAGTVVLGEANQNLVKGEDTVMKINTKRLILEPLGIRFLKTVHEYASDIENTRYMINLPNKSIEETEAFLNKADAEWRSSAPSFYEFAVIYEKKQIGAVSIYVGDDLSGELGWIINKKYWRQGIAYEAAEALMEYSVRELKIRHFTAHCDAENIASYKIMEKLGMSRTGTYGGRKNKSSDEERTEYQYERLI